MEENNVDRRTPFYRANQAERYARQEAIKHIEGITKRQLIVYEANLFNRACSLNIGDIQPFNDLLVGLDKTKGMDLLIQSPGGDIDAAEKIVYMCRSLGIPFRVIVPEYAKSAATLIALASDEILMGIASELGPIDAQLTGPGPGGALFQTSAQCFIDEFDSIKEEVERTGNLSPAYYPLLDGVNLGFIRMCRIAMKRSEKFAAKWLKQFMLKDDQTQANKVAEELCDVKKWLGHGVVIDGKEAKEVLKLNVTQLDLEGELWKMVWYLHCCYGVLFRKSQICKIFESNTVSLPIE